jgi:hypothetical protein
MMESDLRRKAGLILDTNVLLLLVVGVHKRERIITYALTRSYTAGDFDLLLRFTELFLRLVVTPNILTEVSNLLGAKEKAYRPELELLPAVMAKFIEIYEPSHPIMVNQNKFFLKFGLSDVVSCNIVRQDYAILTDDLNLCHYLESNGFAALNFNHLRSPYILPKRR